MYPQSVYKPKKPNTFQVWLAAYNWPHTTIPNWRNIYGSIKNNEICCGKSKEDKFLIHKVVNFGKGGMCGRF